MANTYLSNRAGEQARRENRWGSIEQAARDVDVTWNAWMSDDDGYGFDDVVDAIGRLRAALDGRRAP